MLGVFAAGMGAVLMYMVEEFGGQGNMGYCPGLLRA